MRTVTFQSVLYGLAMSAGLTVPRDLSPARAQMFTEYLNRRLEKCWKFEFFPEWTPGEQRLYRATYNTATAYPGPTPSQAQEVFDPATVGYYQALRATTGNAPTVYSNGVWQVNGAYWALSWQTYGQPVWPGCGYGQGAPTGFSAQDWQPNTAYAGGAVGTAGTQVRNPADNRFYQCHTPHVSGGAFDATKFGLLTPFNKFIALEQAGLPPVGQVKRVCRRNPQVFPKTPGELAFRLSQNGIQLKQDAPAVVWVEYRLRPPVFTSTLWNGAVTYPAGTAGNAQVLSTVDGNGYYALQPSTNQEPSANPAVWGVVNFPEVLASAVKRFALADAYRDQKQNDRADSEEEHAREELQDVWDEEVAGQGQWATARVETYGS